MASNNKSKYPEIVVAGVAAMDIVAAVSEFPQPDELVLTNGVAHYPGGSGANIAVTLAKLGGSVGFIGKLGGDNPGDKLMADFEKNTIDTSAVIVSPAESTPSCFIAVNDQGERIIFALGGAIIDKASDLDIPMIQNAKILCLSDVDGDMVRFSAAKAHQKGAKVFYIPGGMIVSRGIENLTSIMDEIDVLIISESEANGLLPDTDDRELVKSLIKREQGVIIKTMGAKGAILLSATETIFVPAVPVSIVVDTTGAGDAFAAGVITSFLRGESWKQSLTVGCKVASIKLGFTGARAEYPEALLQN